MHVIKFTEFEKLAPYADQWDRLASGVPFQSWAWMSCWWRHYGDAGRGPCGNRLFVLGVFDDAKRLVGLAPWYLNKCRLQGSILRWLGSGEVCSDYLGVLCEPSFEDRVARCLADYLAGRQGDGRCENSRWDLFEIDGVDARNHLVVQMVKHLAGRGSMVHERSAVTCWRIELPTTWDEYLAMLSKPHRKHVRQIERTLCDTGRAVLHTVQCDAELPRAVDLLVDLHQRRRNLLGEPGCFASERYTAFHREVMPLLLAQGQLELHWLELDGRPAATQYCLSGGGVSYVYQGGFDPDLLDRTPGRLIIQLMLRRAIEQGCRAMDFLRGDEPYKQHFRASARPCLALRIVPNRPLARLREGLWLAGRQVKRLVTAKQVEGIGAGG